MAAENNGNKGCLQRDTAEQEEYAGARRSFRQIWKERDSAQPEFLEKILGRDNMNRAFKRVKARKGASGIDGMTVVEALPYLRENKKAILGKIYRGKLFPMRANIYLDEFDHEFQKRGVLCIRYADDIVPLAKSKRASERLLERATAYLENKIISR